MPLIALVVAGWVAIPFADAAAAQGFADRRDDRGRRRAAAVRDPRRHRPGDPQLGGGQPRAVGRDHDVRRRPRARRGHGPVGARRLARAWRCCRCAPSTRWSSRWCWSRSSSSSPSSLATSPPRAGSSRWSPGSSPRPASTRSCSRCRPRWRRAGASCCRRAPGPTRSPGRPATSRCRGCSRPACCSTWPECR